MVLGVLGVFGFVAFVDSGWFAGFGLRVSGHGLVCLVVLV